MASPSTDPDFDSLLPKKSFSRRDFLTAGFALAVQPISAQTTIVTDLAGLSAGEVGIAVAGGTLPAYQARPAKGERLPTVLVVQEIFGVHEHIRDVCRRLAKLGYLALAPELYFRQGDPGRIDNIQEIISNIVAKVPDAQVLSDLDACAAWAAAHGGDAARQAVTGFCWGGRIVWLYAAHNPKLKAGVAWYGRLVGAATETTPKQPIDVAAALKVPVLGLYGGQDEGIPIDTIEQMRILLRAGGSGSEIHVYPDAPHGFFADYRPSYRRAEADDAWQRLQDWLRRHGV